MEKWHLAGIISKGSKPTLILPLHKLNKTSHSHQQNQRSKKVLIMMQLFLRKITEVIALFWAEYHQQNKQFVITSLKHRRAKK